MRHHSSALYIKLKGARCLTHVGTEGTSRTVIPPPWCAELLLTAEFAAVYTVVIGP